MHLETEFDSKVKINQLINILINELNAISLLFLLTLSVTFNSAVIFGEETIGTTASQKGDGNSLVEILYVLIFMIIVINAFRTKGMEFLVSVPNYFSYLLIWCWLSLLWAVDPEIAIRRVVLLTISILSVTYIVRSMKYAKTLNLLIWFLFCMMVIDWISIWLFPLAVHQASDLDLAGDWRGIHSHKNEAGAIYAFCIILFGYAALETRRLLWLASSIAALLFLWMTASKTAIGFVLIAILIGAFAHYGYRYERFRNKAFAIGIISILAALTFATDQVEKLWLVLDDPSAFTGRTKIWPVVLNYASDHPLLGAGYGSFWNIGNASPIFDYAPGDLTAFFTHAHNGYLNVLAELGLVGLTLTVLGMVIRPLFALFYSPLKYKMSRPLLCSMIVFFCLHELLESSFLGRGNSIWLIALIVYCLLSEAAFTSVEKLDPETR